MLVKHSDPLTTFLILGVKTQTEDQLTAKLPHAAAFVTLRFHAQLGAEAQKQQYPAGTVCGAGLMAAAGPT